MYMIVHHLSLFLPPDPIDTAYAQNHINGEWYNFDDSHVSQVNAEDVKV